MRHVFTSKWVENTNQSERRKCLSEAGPIGGYIFKGDYKILPKKSIRVIMIYTEGGDFIGWSIADFSNNYFGRSKGSRVADVYVLIRKKYRRQGYGTWLTKKAVSFVNSKKKRARCYKWDKRSSKFFSGFKKNVKNIWLYSVE